MAEKITYLVTLSCYHTLVFRDPCPALGDIIWCLKCRCETRVKAAPPEWRIRCDMCPYTRRFGTGKTAAEVAAGKHANSRARHVVSLFNGHEFVNTFGQRDLTVTGMLPE